LSKWKLFNKSKRKEETVTEIDTTVDHTIKSEEKILNVTPKSKTSPITEYNETLFSIDSKIKTDKKSSPEKKEPLKRTSWENPKIIEHNIDTMKKTQTESSSSYSQENINIEKKVDQILLKKKMKI
jgi:hypothetical protein